MPRNKELFYAIAEVIENKPQAYDQEHWAAVYTKVSAEARTQIQRAGISSYGVKVDDLTYLRELPTWLAEELHDDDTDALHNPCGTAYCIAGHALIGSGWTTEWSGYDVHRSITWRNPDGDWWDGSFRVEGAKALGLGTDETWLFDANWKPHHCTVPEALRAIGDGMSLHDVTYQHLGEGQ